MNWLHYLAEANAYLVTFYLVYILLLAKDTHYQLNRAYLLLSSAVAFILPLVQLNFLKPTVYVYSDSPYIPAATLSTPFWQVALLYIYLAGALVLLVQFVVKLVQLHQLKRSGVSIEKAGHQLIKLDSQDTAFSFFNYLFIGTRAGNEALIIRHELVHIRQKHSADVIFTELLKIINWFNPVAYLLQNSIRTVHEYIADEQTAQNETDAIAYASFLLDNAYGFSGPAITHSFFNQNLLKKRIIMLDQKRSGKLARLKYLVAVPLCAALLGESTLGFSKSYGFIGIGEQKTATVNSVDTIKKPRVKITDAVIRPRKNTRAKANKLPPPPPIPPAKKRKPLPPPPPPVPPAKPKTAAVTVTAPAPNVGEVTVARTSKTYQLNEPGQVARTLQLNEPGQTQKTYQINEPGQEPRTIRVTEPAKTPKPTGDEIRIEEPVKTPAKSTDNEIRIN